MEVNPNARSYSTTRTGATAIVSLHAMPMAEATIAIELQRVVFLPSSVRTLEGKNTTRWSSIAIVASAIGMACKETMAVAPVLVVLYDRAFGFTSIADQMRRRWRLYAGLAATWLVVGVL